MSDASLLVDPSSKRPGSTVSPEESAKAPVTLPEASPNVPPGVSGSNSTTGRVFRQDIIAICNAKQCGREFPVNSQSDDLPYHHRPNDPGRLKQVCEGSGRRTTVFAEA